MKLRSNEPFWLVKNGLINTYPSVRENLEADIVVVGAGITGSLIAHQSVADGYETIVVDRRETAHGSSSATTSMLQYEIDTQLHDLIEMIGAEGAIASYKACSEAIDSIGSIVKKIKSGCGFEKQQSLYFASYKKDVSVLKTEFDARAAAGFEVEWLEADEIVERFGLHHAHGAILSKQGASMDAFRFTHDLLEYDVKRGLRVFDKTEIASVAYKKAGVTLRTEGGRRIDARKLIYCSGYESTQVIEDKFVDLLSTYAIVGEPCEQSLEHLSATLFWNTDEPYAYMRSTDDNRLLIGGGDEEFVDADKRDSLISEKAAKLEKYLRRIMPDIDFVVDFAWAGTFGSTKDGLPYIGEHPNFPSTYFVLGFGGNGITFSATGMKMISDMLKGIEPELAKAFRFRR